MKYCTRCRCVFHADDLAVLVPAGADMKNPHPVIRLCVDCRVNFARWLKSGPPAFDDPETVRPGRALRLDAGR